MIALNKRSQTKTVKATKKQRNLLEDRYQYQHQHQQHQFQQHDMSPTST